MSVRAKVASSAPRPAPRSRSGDDTEHARVTRQRLLPRILVALCLLAGIARIVSTYPVFNQTWDEPAHVAAGMEWLDRGPYTYEPLHPPLARVMVALGPWLAGIRSAGHPDVWLEGNSILYAGHRYERNLALARLGVLPFFLLAGLVTYLWTARIAGPWSGVAAAALFTTLPPVLAHSGIATTDMAATATVAFAAYALTLWLERATWGLSLLLGAALALAVLSKLSALLFLPAAALAILLCRRGEPASRALATTTPRESSSTPTPARLCCCRSPRSRG